MKNSTPYLTPKNHFNVEANTELNQLHSPSSQSINLILAYSKSLEARPSKFINKVLLNLN